jgi:hypothetical protein
MQYDTLLQEKERIRGVIIPESTEEFNGIVLGFKKEEENEVYIYTETT